MSKCKRHKASSEKTDARTSTTDAAQSSDISIKGCESAAPNFLELFWKLASIDNDTRQTTVNALIDYLKSEESEKQDKLITYTLNRLICGLASSRDAARPGFSAALATILREFPTIEIKSVLQMADDLLQWRAAMPSFEQREHIFGQLFGLMAIYKSKRLESQDMLDLKVQVIQKMIKLSFWKDWLREACYECILLFLSTVDVSTFKSIQHSIVKILPEKLELYTTDHLQLLVGLHQYMISHNILEDPETLSVISITGRFYVDNRVDLDTAIRKSSSCYPRIHSVWYNLFGMAIAEAESNEKLLDDIWNLYVEGILIAEDSTHERKGLALKLFELVLPKVSGSFIRRTVLTEKFLVLLRSNAMKKKNVLHPVARQCLQTFALSNLEEYAYFLMRNMVQPLIFHRSVNDTTKSENTTDANATLNVEEEMDDQEAIACETNVIRTWAAELLTDSISQHTETDSDVDATQREKILRFLILQLYNTGSIPQADSKSSQKHSLTSNFPELADCFASNSAEIPVSPFVRATIAKRLFTLSSKDLSDPKQMNTLRICFTIITKELFKKKKKRDCGGEFISKDFRARLETLRTRVDELSKLAGAECSTDEQRRLAVFSEAVLVLLMLNSQLLLDDDQRDFALELCDDLDRCYTEIAIRIKDGVPVDTIDSPEKEKSSEAPQPMVVLMDILLSLLSQDSHGIRAIISHVFAMIVPFVNRQSLATIVRALVPEGATQENADEAIEEDEDKPETDEESADEAEEEIHLASDNQVSEMLWDDADPNNLDQEEKALATIVRQAQDKSKQKQRETFEKERQTHFQSRVLELIHIFVAKTDEKANVLFIIMPLVKVLERTQGKTKPSEILHARTIQTLMKHFVRAKELPVLKEQTQITEALQVLDHISAVVTRSKPHASTASTCVSLLVYILRVIHRNNLDCDALIIEETRKLMKRMVDESVTRKKCPYAWQFFDQFINRHISSAFQLLYDPLSCALDNDVCVSMSQYKRSQLWQGLQKLFKSKVLLQEPQKHFSLYAKCASRISNGLSAALNAILQNKLEAVDKGIAQPNQTKQLKVYILLVRDFLKSSMEWIQKTKCSSEDIRQLTSGHKEILSKMQNIASNFESPKTKNGIEQVFVLLKSCDTLPDSFCEAPAKVTPTKKRKNIEL